MKTRYRCALACALIASTLTVPASLFAAATLFTTSPQFVIDSIDFDDAGDLFYLRTDFDFGAAAPQSTTLIKRTKASGYTDPVTVFDYGARKFSSFVTTTSTRAYFGESSDGTIRSVALDGSDPILHATIAFNYDLAISPGGEAFVSANAGGFGQGNVISRVDLGTGATQTLIDNTNDFSGPIEFDLAGNLFYGGTGSPFAVGPPTDIFRFTGAEIAGALATTPIDLSGEPSFSPATGNSHFAFAPGIGLFSHPPSGVPGGLVLVDTVTGSTTPVSGAPTTGTLGALAHNGASLYGITTDFSTNTSSFVLIPEPSRALLAMIATISILSARRKNLFTRLL